LLTVGAAAGLAAALAVALGLGLPRQIPADAVALVGSAPIGREDLARAYAALEADKRNPLTDEDRAYALRRLVEEEALVQRGIALGIATQDPNARKAIVQAMIQFATAQALAEKPTEAALRTFYAERPALFAAEPQVRAAAIVIPVTDAQRLTRVRDAVASGATFKDIATRQREGLAPVPDRLLSPDDLRTYLGPTVAAAAFKMEPGQSAGPIVVGSAAVFVAVAERADAAPPPFETARAAVETEWRRRREDDALDRYLEKLRRDGEISYAKDAPR
jgi:parvulin-like peptidyl-prolyl isomerase